MRYRFTIGKGSTALGLKKADVGTFTLEAVSGYGVRVRITYNGRYGKHEMRFWMTGNRKHVPTFEVDDAFNVHDGNPLHKAQIVVTAVEPQ